MKTGKTLVELATEIERQANNKRDLVASTSQMALNTTTIAGPSGVRTALALTVGDNRFGINEIAHDQIATHTGVPAKYYDRMRVEAPELLAQNVNTWLAKQPAKRLVRTMDGTARAFLSDSYRPLENSDLAQAVLPILRDLNLDLVSCEITERRLFLKCVDQSIQRDIPAGRKMGDGSHTIFDTCVPALTISNSEVGHGMLRVDTGVLTHACTNLAFFSQSGMRRRHVGAKHELLAADSIMELLSDDTRRATDRALWLQVRDVVRGAFDEARFDAQIARIRDTTDQKIEADPVKVVEFAAKRFSLNDGERTGVLRHLIEGADLSRYGLFNAVTRTAEDAPSYDRASELEHLGGQIIDLPASHWREIANAHGDPYKVAA